MLETKNKIKLIWIFKIIKKEKIKYLISWVHQISLVFALRYDCQSNEFYMEYWSLKITVVVVFIEELSFFLLQFDGK